VWLGVAQAVATRSSCSRDQVGAVLVVDNYWTFVGYNGPKSGETNCDDGGCPRGLLTTEQLPHGARFDGAGACSAVHAEVNAMLKFQHHYWTMDPSVFRMVLQGCVMYTTREPCERCWVDIRKWLKPEQVVWSK
jgi:dCMP deaminase